MGEHDATRDDVADANTIRMPSSRATGIPRATGRPQGHVVPLAPLDLDALETERVPVAPTAPPATGDVEELPTVRMAVPAPAAPPADVALAETVRVPSAPASTSVVDDLRAAFLAQEAQGMGSTGDEVADLPTQWLRVVLPLPDAPRTARGRPRRWTLAAVLALVLVLVPLLVVLSRPEAQAALRNAFGREATRSATRASTATPGATATPALTPEQRRQQAERQYVDGLIAKMSLDEELGQMMMLGFNETEISPALVTSLKQYHVGSVILYAFNITSGDQVSKLVSDLQANADLPLLVATDQEGGGVNRLLAVSGPRPSAADIAARNDPAYARQRGADDARDLAALGINLNLAPVVDVPPVPNGGGDLSGRTFGTDPQRVATLAGAYLDGLQADHRVAGTLKHFPGLGSVPTDPHHDLYTLNRSVADMDAVDWAPYRALIASHSVAAVMSTHVILANVDPDRPATLSQPVITGILRQKLGFDGVVITDGIYMDALRAHYTFDQIILDAIEAGNDIICSTYSIESTARAEQVLKDAVSRGELTKARIDDSVRRILLLKLHYGMLPGPTGSAG